jgi:hypothetical protein
LIENQKTRQIEYYADIESPEVEITRPRCYPRPVQFLLDFKLRSVTQMLNGVGSGEQVLVACCGSGMDAEFLARERDMQVVGLDLSYEALLRAKERAKRYDVGYHLVVGDVEHLPFKNESFDLAFVHDGLHHLPDAYLGVREMLRMASRAVLVAEPADAPLTRLAVKLGLSGKYEEAGNYVYRLDQERLAAVFAKEGADRWAFRHHLIYYQPWTYRIYGLLEREPLFTLFRFAFYIVNLFLGQWGNSLKTIAWKEIGE